MQKSVFHVGLIGLFLLCGCATNPKATAPLDPASVDPLERLNRDIYGFNKAFDRYLLKPVAIGYRIAMPYFIQSGVTHFFSNLREIPSTANNLLQGRIEDAANDTGRFVMNSTIGIFGLFDPARHFGIMPRPQDFGQTLARWGMRDSTYIVLPFIGPSTLRDSVGLGVDYYYFSAWTHIHPDSTRYELKGLEIVSLRSSILPTERAVQVAASMDEYTFVRNAYLQHRAHLISGGVVALDDDSDDLSMDEMKNIEKN